MDGTTLFGLIGVAAMVAIAIVTGQVSKVFLNFHGIFLVCGGTFCAMLLNTPWKYFWAAVKIVPQMLFPKAAVSPEEIIPILVATAQDVHSRGVVALRGVDARGGPFFQHAAQIASEFSDPDYVKDLLENELNKEYDHNNEVVNVIRTMVILAPMFGLIGTLIGIVDVLKQISNPEMVGPAMAVAVTTAFYGISMANLVAVPIAGKIRLHQIEEQAAKAMIVEAIVAMLKGAVPALLEKKLRTYIVH